MEKLKEIFNWIKDKMKIVTDATTNYFISIITAVATMLIKNNPINLNLITVVGIINIIALTTVLFISIISLIKKIIYFIFKGESLL